MSDGRYQSFEEFFPFYLSEHSHALNRWLHFVGTSLGVCVLAAAAVLSSPWLVLAAPVVGYGFAWFGHFVVERNKPASFAYPWWSFLGDFRMYRLMLTGGVQRALDAYAAQAGAHSLDASGR